MDDVPDTSQGDKCIFCKIIKGDIPSRKVYEDDRMIAILDINPAVKGHLLVLPKEHYPILPVIPLQLTQHLYARTRDIIAALKEALLCQGVTIFIANGAVAGQQSPHFLYHIIPREGDDGLDVLQPTGEGDKAVNDGLGSSIAQKITGLMHAYLRETNRQNLILDVQPPTPPAPITEDRLDKLIGVINENDDLKAALIERPEEVKKAVVEQDRWRALFAGVNIDELSNNLKKVAVSKAQSNLDYVDKLFR